MDAVRVSGIGAVSAAGFGVDALWRGMLMGSPRIAAAEDSGLVGRAFDVYRGPNESDDAHRIGPNRATEYALYAVREAMQRAVAFASPVPAGRTAVIVGTGMGDACVHEDPAGTPATRPMYAPAAAVAGAVGAEGPVVSVSNACAASAYAVDMAVGMLRAGDCDRAIVAGVEAYSRVALYCFERIRGLDPRSCRPFAIDRAGTMFGEGAAALVLDAETTAGRPRPGIHVKATATSCDGGHPTAPDPTGEHARRAFLAALAEAGIAPSDVGAVLPHGTGTQLNDAVEARLLRELEDLAGRPVPAYCLKSVIGHTGGAAGAMALVAAVTMIERGHVPRNVDVGAVEEDARASVDGADTSLRGDVVVNAYAFGGANASVVVGGIR